MGRINYTKLTVDEMLIRLGRYPMEERLSSMLNASIGFIRNNYNVKKTFDENGTQPWEMETFLLLCIMANNKFTPNSFATAKGKREKLNILSNIRMGMEFWDDYGCEDHFEVILTTHANLEFPIQQYNFYHSTYRFSYIFNSDKALQAEFKKKYGVEYVEIVSLFHLIDIIMRRFDFKPDVFNYLLKKYFNVCNIFSYDLDDLIEDQRIICPDLQMGKYSLKLFVSHPFIHYGHFYYFPLPHTLITACTDSLLIRLTSESKCGDDLRQAFGVPFERYLYKILNDSKIYSQTTSETLYLRNEDKIKSSDVVVTDGDSIVFMDAKLSQTNSKVRVADLKTIEKCSKQYAEGIVQLYKRMNEYPEFFNPFDLYCKKENVFGLLVVLEDANLLRSKIYKYAFDSLQILEGSEVAKYIKSNIAICGINELEQLTFYGKSIIPHLIYRRDSKLYANYSIINNEIYLQQKGEQSPQIKEHISTLCNTMIYDIEDLLSKQIIALRNE